MKTLKVRVVQSHWRSGDFEEGRCSDTGGAGTLRKSSAMYGWIIMDRLMQGWTRHSEEKQTWNLVLQPKVF